MSVQYGHLLFFLTFIYMSVRCIFYINTTFSLDQQKSKNASQVDIQHKNAELHEAC